MKRIQILESLLGLRLTCVRSLRGGGGGFFVSMGEPASRSLLDLFVCDDSFVGELLMFMLSSIFFFCLASIVLNSFMSIGLLPFELPLVEKLAFLSSRERLRAAMIFSSIVFSPSLLVSFEPPPMLFSRLNCGLGGTGGGGGGCGPIELLLDLRLAKLVLFEDASLLPSSLFNAEVWSEKFSIRWLFSINDSD